MIDVNRQTDLLREAAMRIAEPSSRPCGTSALAELHLVGLSFRTADLALRGRVSFSGDRLDTLLTRIKDAGVSECLALCTCNRTEILFFGDDGDCVRRILAELTEVQPEELESHLYAKSGDEAAQHLFSVCSGLESAVLGETDILAQVKSAVEFAREREMVGPWLNLLVRHALAASKKVRTDTDLCKGVTSLGSQAVREARSIAGGLAGKTILLVGAGKIAERVAKDIVLENPARVVVANRTIAAAEVLAKRYGFEVCPLEEVAGHLREIDLVITAVGARTPLFGEAEFSAAMDHRGDRRLIVVDLGVPANVSKEAKRVPGVHAVDMDHLIERCTRNTERREAAIPAARASIHSAIVDLNDAFAERESAPTIQMLVKRCEEIREQNLAWALEKLGDVDEKQRKVVEDLALRMMRGLLESPIRSLKTSRVSAEERDVVVRLFEAGGEQNP